jgi:hypothetical protein
MDALRQAGIAGGDRIERAPVRDIAF